MRERERSFMYSLTKYAQKTLRVNKCTGSNFQNYTKKSLENFSCDKIFLTFCLYFWKDSMIGLP